jgi:hypothetical protein
MAPAAATGITIFTGLEGNGWEDTEALMTEKNVIMKNFSLRDILFSSKKLN